jgi:hypothetical protein
VQTQQLINTFCLTDTQQDAYRKSICSELHSIYAQKSLYEGLQVSYSLFLTYFKQNWTIPTQSNYSKLQFCENSFSGSQAVSRVQMNRRTDEWSKFNWRYTRLCKSLKMFHTHHRSTDRTIGYHTYFTCQVAMTARPVIIKSAYFVWLQ